MPRTHQWRALGTYAQLVVEDDADQDQAVQVAKQLVDDVDRTCSRFRGDSDLVRASRGAGSWVAVDPLLVRAVDAALQAARDTGGLVDPTLGRDLAAVGYDRDLGLVRSGARVPADAVLTAPAVPGERPDEAWRLVETDPQGWLRVPVGCSLDLGATGKAFAADLVVDALHERLGTSSVVSLGGDVAARCRADQPGWVVLVSDTEGADLDQPGELVRLTGRAGLATSSTLHRRWSHDGAEVHHILDPRTGLPATTSVASVSARAASCVAANAATTAAVVVGAGAADWLEERAVAALVLHADGTRRETSTWGASLPVGAPC